jgi:hypothetical protein
VWNRSSPCGRSNAGLDFIAIERELSELIGRRMDLLTPKFSSPRMREDVLRGAEFLCGGAATNSLKAAAARQS